MTNTYTIPTLENGEPDYALIAKRLRDHHLSGADAWFQMDFPSAVAYIKDVAAHATAKERERCIEQVRGLEIQFPNMNPLEKELHHKAGADRFRKAAITAIEDDGEKE